MINPSKMNIAEKQAYDERTQDDSDLAAEFLLNNEVTKCPVGAAKGNNLSKLAREDVARQRREARKNE